MNAKSHISRITTTRSMNFPITDSLLKYFEHDKALRRFYESCGLNGLEVIRTLDADQGKIKRGMVNGVHLFFHVFWMDWWKGNFGRLDEMFDSREQWLSYFGGTGHESYLKSLREDLHYAEEIGAKYVVFHVSESTMEECVSRKFHYTHEEVIDASLEVICELLGERDYPFTFLVENLWWSGLTLEDARLTRRLLEGIPCENKGIMLDTGHYMNTNPALTSREEAVAYLHAMLDQHEQEGLLSYFKGVHLHMSLGGEYYRASLKEPGLQPDSILQQPFYEQYRIITEHTGKIDRHRPFVENGVRKLLERMPLAFITYEFAYTSPEEYAYMAKAQNCVWEEMSGIVAPDISAGNLHNKPLRES